MRAVVAGSDVYAYTGSRPVDAALPTVLFVHGAGNDHSVWALQSRYFAHHGCNALAVDLPGARQSRAAPRLLPSRRWRDWIRALRSTRQESRRRRSSATRWDRSRRSSARRGIPERVTKLALVGTAAPMPVSEMLLDAAKRNDHVACELITGWSYSPGKQIGGSQVPGLWLTGNALRLLERDEARRALRRSRRVQQYGAGEASAAKVRCPVLAILGARDLMAPAKNAQRLIARIARREGGDDSGLRPRADGRAARRRARRVARVSSPRQPRHLIEQPTDGCWTSGAFPLRAIDTMASKSSRFAVGSDERPDASRRPR